MFFRIFYHSFLVRITPAAKCYNNFYNIQFIDWNPVHRSMFKCPLFFRCFFSLFSFSHFLFVCWTWTSAATRMHWLTSDSRPLFQTMQTECFHFACETNYYLSFFLVFTSLIEVTVFFSLLVVRIDFTLVLISSSMYGLHHPTFFYFHSWEVIQSDLFTALTFSSYSRYLVHKGK